MSSLFDGMASEQGQKARRFRFRRLYVLSLVLFALPALGAFLTLIELKRDGFGGVDGLGGAAAVAVSPDGRQVYVAGQDDNAVAAFHREASLGTLSFLEHHEDEEDGVFGLLGVSALAVSPDGRHVYAAGEHDDSLVVFARDATEESLSFLAAEVKENHVGGVFALNGVSSVTVTGDDKLVLATSRIDDALVVFSRDASTDALTFVEAELDGYGGVHGLDGASSAAASPDARHVYVTGDVDDSLAVFKRRLGPRVDFLRRYRDGVGGVDGLNGASSVVVSGDGLNVYVAGRVDNAVAAFSRNPVTGNLTFLGVNRDGVKGVNGLAGASSLALSPQGDRLFVAGPLDDAVAVFRRNPATGALDFLEMLRAGAPGTGALGEARSVAVSPDAWDLYVAGHAHDTLAGVAVASCDGNEYVGDSDGDAFCDNLDLCTGDDLTGDTDADGVCNDLDLCPGWDDTADADADGVADGCDLCWGDDATGDSDGDGVCNDSDACPGWPDGFDADADGIPDGCDVCQGENATGDTDADGVCNDLDACLGDDATGDSDGDGVCTDLDCAPGDPGAWEVTCGVCGGTGSDCAVFSDGFESGGTAGWSATVGG